MVQSHKYIMGPIIKFIEAKTYLTNSMTFIITMMLFYATVSYLYLRLS